jgi:hypothetical protein
MAYARQVAADALAGKNEDAVQEEVDRVTRLFPGPKDEVDPQALGIAFAMLQTGFTEADIVCVLGYMPNLKTAAADLAEMERQMSDNPQGLATFDPMEDPRYRAVVRRIVEEDRRRRGLPPLNLPEDKE